MAEVNDDARTDLVPVVVEDNTAPAPEPTFDTGKAELEALRRAVEEEEAASGETPEPEPAAAPVVAEAPAPVAPPAPPAPIMVPKQRFDEVLQRLRNTEAERLRLEGALRVTTSQAAPAAPVAPPAPTLDQLIQGEQTKVDEGATKFDAGEISMSEFVRIQAAANATIQGLREQALYEAVVARQPQASMADTLLMDRETSRLEAAHPWLAVISQDGNRLHALADVARASLAAKGEPIQGSGPAEDLRLRAEVARLSNRYGPEWYPNLIQQAPAQAAPPARPPAPTAPAGNPLARAAAHPPNINQMGHTGLASNDPTEVQLEAMSTDQIAALPAAVRARLMQG